MEPTITTKTASPPPATVSAFVTALGLIGGGMLAGSALWGVWLGRLAGARDQLRMAAAGALGFAPITITLGLVLSLLEPVAVDRLGAQFPIARLFTLFFVPTAFLIAGVGAWA